MPRSLAGGHYSLSKRHLVCQGTKKHSTGEPADNRVCCSPRCKQPGASVPVLGTFRHQICRSCRCRFDRPNPPRYKVRIVSHTSGHTSPSRLPQLGRPYRKPNRAEVVVGSTHTLVVTLAPRRLYIPFHRLTSTPGVHWIRIDGPSSSVSGERSAGSGEWRMGECELANGGERVKR